MSMYLSPDDHRRTEAEADEFIDSPVGEGAVPEIPHPVRDAGVADIDHEPDGATDHETPDDADHPR